MPSHQKVTQNKAGKGTYSFTIYITKKIINRRGNCSCGKGVSAVMNRRQKKKHERYEANCIEFGCHYVPAYTELRKMERAYHHLYIGIKKSECENSRLSANKFIAIS